MGIHDIIDDLKAGVNDPACTKRKAMKFEKFISQLIDISERDYEFVPSCPERDIDKERNALILVKGRFFNTSHLHVQPVSIYQRTSIINKDHIDHFRIICGRPHQAVWNKIRYNIVDEFQDFAYYYRGFFHNINRHNKYVERFNSYCSQIELNGGMMFIMDELEKSRNFENALKESGPEWLQNYLILR